MPDQTLHLALDALLTALHALLVGFNMLGWAWRRTRRLHLVAICATLLSWFGLGVAYGWGYCPLTDWHWEVKRALGETGLPASCIKYHLDRITGVDWSSGLVDGVVVGSAAAALAASVILNARDRVRRSPGSPRSRP